MIDKKIAWSLIFISFILSIIDNILKMPLYIGGWNIVKYILLLLPLIFMIYKKSVNKHIKLVVPILIVMIFDMGYYNNDMVQLVVPVVFYWLLISLYISSKSETESFYTLLLPTIPFGKATNLLLDFFYKLSPKSANGSLFRRIFLGIAITIPFLLMFGMLLWSADNQFSSLFSKIFNFDIEFNSKYIINVPILTIFYLLLFVYAFSNQEDSTTPKIYKKMDLLIIGIFLSLINLLFITFITLQVPFLLDSANLPEGINIAEFARKGFFELMIVMGLVLLIFLFIAKRYRGELTVTVLLSILLIESIIMGIVSLKKIYLYQSIKGATVLRYYVEWFDYFLIFVLLMSIVALIKRVLFIKILNAIFMLGLVSFTIIISINIDALVASTNISKFKDEPLKLDKKALAHLSIDAMPVIKRSKIDFDLDASYFIIESRKDCTNFSNYHYGYCQKIKQMEKR